MTEEKERLRIDKWLWAARFFKTRAQAKDAIESGKVQHEGLRVKVGKEVKVGMVLSIRQGSEIKTIEIKGLASARGAAPVAQLLYEETSESVAARELHGMERKTQNLAHPDHRPDKKERRQIHKFKDGWQ